MPDSLYRGAWSARRLLGVIAVALCAMAWGGRPTAGLAAATTPELPDGRGYEMVSPVPNADGDVYEPTLEGLNGDGGNGYSTERPFQVATGGEAVAYVGDPPAEGGTGSEGKGAGNEYLATHAPRAGWSAENIEPPSASLAEGESVFQGFSSDLSVGVLDWDGQAPLTAGAPGGSYHVLYSRTTPDGMYHPLFSTTPHNRTSAEFEVTYAGASANFEDLLFMANDALTPEALAGGADENNLYDSAGGQLRSVNVLAGKADPNATFGAPPQAPGEPSDFSHVISADGSRIFWTDLNTGELYVRENGETTVQVSAGAAQFQTASADGDYTFYTEDEKLYRFDVETGARDELAGAGVEGVIGVNEEGKDGSYLYFVANDDLYVLHNGEAAHLIAQLSPADDGDWSPGLADRTAQVTPDGEHLVFVSRRNLTGYENAGHTEVYLYDAQSETQPEALKCVSCNLSGEPPSSGSEYSAVLQPSHSDTYVPHWISADGVRVFFDSVDALVPQVSNDRLDVYEWERDGVGSCAQLQGCIFLLSGGTSTDNSYFVDASSSGNDVFILTREQLVSQDQDEAFVLYDARVGAPSQATVSTACSGSGCQGEPSPPLNLSTPASVTFEGLGNLPPTAAVVAKPKSKPPTRAQKLAKALKACRSKRTNKKRAACARHAQKQYGARSVARKSTSRGGS